MNSERKMKEVKREIDAIREGLNDTLAKSMVKLCNSTIETIEMNRASKLKVWKEAYKPLCLGADARKDSVEYKQKIVDKYYHLHKALPALETLRDIDLARKFALEQLNTQVLAAEEGEKQEQLSKEKQIISTGGGRENRASNT